MTKKITLLLLGFIICQHLVQAQSIIINHQFQGTTVFDLSFGGGKIGWVTYDSSLANPYTYHYMNNLQNTISVNDTTLTDLNLALHFLM
jgi:hypothetical protein